MKWRTVLPGNDYREHIGTNSPTLSVTPYATQSYWVIVSNTCGQATSQAATVTVSAAARLTLSATSLSFDAGGPSQSITVDSTGGPLTFWIDTNTASGGNWLSIDSCWAVSLTPCSTTARISVSVGVVIAPGDYQGTLTISSNSAGNSPQIVTVALHVPQPTIGPALTVTKNALTFQNDQNSTSVGQTVTVGNTSGAALAFTILSSQPWIRLDRVAGVTTGDRDDQRGYEPVTRDIRRTG